ncbi:g11644 [Coccomyxa viridis]|uniref:G11644 protein n=1 Tax=Coccomyxa viridis TaxID=1274662 RepID=A0ABP1GB31_9CHLO
MPPQPPKGTVPIEDMRRGMSRMPVPDPEPVHHVEDKTIPGPASQLPVRIYKPQAPAGQQLSALVYYHGGGFIFGGLQSHDPMCRAVANKVPCIVVSVDYRLAPEHPFPAAVDDCLAAAEWVAANLESLGATSGKLAVGGDSAGANLAAVTAVSARDCGGPKFAHQLLIYPVVDSSQVNGEFKYESYKECGPGTKGLLDSSDALWLTKHYLTRPEDATDPRFAVIRADHKGLPPATVITCEVDPLRDEGKAYAEKLKAAGVQVNSFHYKGTFHGFMQFPVPQAKEALEAMSAELRSAFSV